MQHATTGNIFLFLGEELQVYQYDFFLNIHNLHKEFWQFSKFILSFKAHTSALMFSYHKHSRV